MRRMLPLALVLLFVLPALPALGQVPISPFAETVPLPSASSSYADPAIYLNPLDLSRSLILAADGTTALQVYDLQGRQVTQYAGTFKQVDVTYDFVLGGAPVPLVAARTVDDHVLFFTLDPSSAALTNVSAAPVAITPGAGCMRLVRPPDAPGTFELWTTSDAKVERWRLRADAGVGQVTADRLSTSLGVLSASASGCAADEQSGVLYVAESTSGLYRVLPRLDGGIGAAAVAQLGVTPLESAASLSSVSLVHVSSQEGYLVLGSLQPLGTVFSIFDTQFEAWVTDFRVGDAGVVDGVSGSLGAVATNLSLGSDAPGGLFVAHDGLNTPDFPNFKLVSWQSLATGLHAADAGTLQQDPSYDPRSLDGGHISLPDAGGATDAGAGPGGSGGSGSSTGDVDAPKNKCGCGAVDGSGPVLLLAGLFLRRARRRPRS